MTCSQATKGKKSLAEGICISIYLTTKFPQPKPQLPNCSKFARPGIDPRTNKAGNGVNIDDDTATATVAPDGTLFIGTWAGYNWAQGHLFHVGNNGKILQAYNFGWDTTPAVFQHNGTYSVITKENHYTGVGDYCNVESVCPSDRTKAYPNNPAAFFITQLSPELKAEWQYKNTNHKSCVRHSNGKVTCVSDHPDGFEWCVNAAGVDKNGTVYGNAEDAVVYAIKQGGLKSSSIFLNMAVPAAYTPVSIDNEGRIYVQDFGTMFLVGH